MTAAHRAHRLTSSHRAAVSRRGVVTVTAGAAALVAATALTLRPELAASVPAPAPAVDADPSVAVHALTPVVEAGGTARLATGVATPGQRPEGRVELQVGDRRLVRELSVGTAVVGVAVDEPGTLRIRARYLPAAAAPGAWSEPATIRVRPAG